MLRSLEILRTSFANANLLTACGILAKMPTIKYFEKYPAFPTDVPVVDLRSLSLRKLMAEDKSESNRLFEASKEVGFFLVHLKDSAEGEDMLRHAELAFDLNEKLFETYQGELMKYAVDPPDLMGYAL